MNVGYRTLLIYVNIVEKRARIMKHIQSRKGRSLCADLLLPLLRATMFIAGAPIIGASVGAAPVVGPGTVHGAAASLNVVEQVQFIWLGHNYCWYDDGWNGPGWYWCDQYLVPGVGWGAPTAGIIGVGDIAAGGLVILALRSVIAAFASVIPVRGWVVPALGWAIPVVEWVILAVEVGNPGGRIGNPGGGAHPGGTSSGGRHR